MSKSSNTICVLSCDGVSKTFPICNEGSSWRLILGNDEHEKKISALNDISLNVPKGKFVGVLGRNGAGKSTLLRVLGGVYSPTAGKIKINGQVSGLFELGGFGNRYITGREYAKRILQIQGVKKAKLSELIEEIKDFSELGESFDRQVNTYSSGMAARLYFATATALQHDIYLIDEILSVGDEHFQAKCWQRLRERFSHGASGILVTHDWSAILKLCEEAHIIEGGRIIHSGRSDKIVQTYLDLPKPKKQLAWFDENTLVTYEALSGEDMEFNFDVTVSEYAPIEFNYSIEMLRVGIGWEILLLNPTWMFIADSPGRYTVSLKIPKLPLSPGQYYLNLFLNSSRKNAASLGCDAKTWTMGNGIDLIVNGKESNTALILPMSWQRVEHVTAN